MSEPSTEETAASAGNPAESRKTPARKPRAKTRSPRKAKSPAAASVDQVPVGQASADPSPAVAPISEVSHPIVEPPAPEPPATLTEPGARPPAGRR